MKKKLTKLRPDELTLDDRLQPRDAGLNPATVDEYAAAWAAKAAFPNLVAFDVDGTLYLTSGRHRLAGAIKAGVTRVPVEVFTGTWKDAVLNAAGSNPNHGLPRTTADKRRAIEMVLKEFPNWTDGKVADGASVSRQMVSDYRAGRSQSLPPDPAGEAGRDWQSLPVDPEPEVREGKDGRTYKVKPKAKKHAAPKAVKPAAPKADPEPDDQPVADDANAGGTDLPAPEDSVPFDEEPASDAAVADAEGEPVADNPDTREFVRRGRHVAAGDPEFSTYLIGIYIPAVVKTARGGTVVLDGTGKPVPQHMADDFASPRHRAILEDMAKVAEDALALRTELGETLRDHKSKVNMNPFLDTEDYHRNFDTVVRSLHALRDALRDCLPFAVCPVCGGDGGACKPCRTAGFLTETAYGIYEMERKRGAA